MFNILFGDSKDFMVTIAKGLKLEDAIQFALNLHRSSNVEHVISVFDDDDKSFITLSNIKE